MTEVDITEPTSLTALADQLVAELPQHSSGRTARTVLSGPLLRAVVMALAEGSELAEHDAPRAATLQGLVGEVTVRAGEQSWRVRPGELLPIPHERHAVTVAQVRDELARQRQVRRSGVLRRQDRDLLVHREAPRTDRHLLRFGEDERSPGGVSKSGGPQK